MNKIQGLLLIVLLVAACPGRAEAAPYLTPEDCRRHALAWNQELQIAQNRLEEAQLLRKSYKANFFPSISLSASALYSSFDAQQTLKGGYLPTFAYDADGVLQPQISGMAADGTPIFASYAFMPDIALSLRMRSLLLGGVSLEQPVYMGGKVRTAYRMSGTGVEMASLSQELQRTDVLLASDKAFYQCVEARAMVASLHKYEEMLDELVRVVGNAVDAGLAQRKDLLAVQVKQNEVTLGLRRAENAVRLADLNLGYVTGISLPSDGEIPEEVAVEPLSVLPGWNPSDRPEDALLSMQASLKQDEAELKRAALRPQIGLMASYNYSDGLEFNDEKLLNGGSLLTALQLQIPLVHAGEGRWKVQAAEKAARQAELKRADTEMKMQLEYTQAAHVYDEALLEVELTARSMEQAAEHCKVSRDRYEAGKEMLSDLLEAQAMWQKADAERIAALSQLGIAKTALLKAAGQL